MYSIFKDGVLIEQQAWDGDWITCNVDGLSVGVYNFTLEILDTFAETASDTVMVTVNPQTTATTDQFPSNPNTLTTTNGTTTGGIQMITIVISIGSTIVIIVVIVLMLKTKQQP